jgi:hypothetical protein
MVGKPEWKRQLERPRRGWKDNIKLVIIEIGWEWTGFIFQTGGRFLTGIW